MTQYAWVIDQTRCIGCHACTTACKSENDVALGVFRTWVKAVEVGRFPEVRRHFAVLRCNHCEQPPCVDICPVTAMYQRPDGLVDFDHDRCIGCKACMQACPYDAIHMDPDSNTAAKCNFCSHRVDEGLLPACVVVCPEEALLFGDLEDATSAVSRALGKHAVTVRRPEQSTRPKAYYIGAHEAALDPLAARHDAMYMWADAGDRGTGGQGDGTVSRRTARTPVPPSPRPPALPARVAYDIPRQRTWDWKVSSYIWTKSIAAGAGLFAAVEHAVGTAAGSLLPQLFMPLVALIFLTLTGVLLVADLKRPERFWFVLAKAQWKSWLARGAVIITLFGTLLAIWIAGLWTGSDRTLDLAAWPLGLLSLATATYTAFLFAQCEGRDLWQGPLFGIELALEAPLAALAVVCVAATGARAADAAELARQVAGLTTLLTAVILFDAFGRHGTPNARAAAHALTRGRQATMFWTALLAGFAAPVLLLLQAGANALPIAGVLILAGLWLRGHAFVLAGQGPPIS